MLNLSLGYIKTGDVLKVYSPVLVKFGNDNLDLIRVDNPFQIILNESPIPNSACEWIDMFVSQSTS